MATKNMFGMMLNEKPVTSTPQIKAPAVRVNKPPPTHEFAYLGNPKQAFRSPLMGRGQDEAAGIWGKMLGTNLGRMKKHG